MIGSDLRWMSKTVWADCLFKHKHKHLTLGICGICGMSMFGIERFSTVTNVNEQDGAGIDAEH